MKQNSFKSMLVLAITIAFISCSKEKERIINDVKDNSSEIISINTAREVALSFANKQLSNQNGSLVTLAIEKEERITNTTRDTTPYFYVFNFKNNTGFVLVSADKREHPILAYSNQGSFDYSNAPEQLKYWTEITKENINNLKKGIFKKKKQTDMEWKFFEKILSSQSSRVPTDPNCQDNVTTYTVGPFLSTTWGQGEDYNDLTPSSNVSYYNYHCPTGCVPTAMVQIMRYWQKPSSYNWTSMPNNSGSSEVSRIMHDAGIAVNADYQPYATSASKYDISPAMKNSFWYSYASLDDNYQNDDFLKIQSELNASRPVLLGGNDINHNNAGHAWVCDGYKQTNITWCNDDGTGGGAGFLSFHMNWGWDGHANGYYSFDTWNPIDKDGSQHNYENERGFVVIHP